MWWPSRCRGTLQATWATFSTTGEDRILFCGDLIHVPAAQFARPELTWANDDDQSIACATRIRLLGEASTTRAWLAGDTWPSRAIGRIVEEGSGIRLATRRLRHRGSESFSRVLAHVLDDLAVVGQAPRRRRYRPRPSRSLRIARKVPPRSRSRPSPPRPAPRGSTPWQRHRVPLVALARRPRGGGARDLGVRLQPSRRPAPGRPACPSPWCAGRRAPASPSCAGWYARSPKAGQHRREVAVAKRISG